MNHIEIERDIVLEVRLRLPRYAGIAYIGEWFRPVHQPAGIKLGYHIRAYSPVILVHHLFQVLHVLSPFAVGNAPGVEPPSNNQLPSEVNRGTLKPASANCRLILAL